MTALLLTYRTPSPPRMRCTTYCQGGPVTLDLLVLLLASLSSSLVLRVRVGESGTAPLLREKFPRICLVLILARSITHFLLEVSPAATQEWGLWASCHHAGVDGGGEPGSPCPRVMAGAGSAHISSAGWGNLFVNNCLHFVCEHDCTHRLTFSFLSKLGRKMLFRLGKTFFSCFGRKYN